jgi:NADPH-dependent curcumin reductase CurA
MNALPYACRKWIVASPLVEGTIRPENFALIEQPLRALAPGEALVRTGLINLHSRTRLKLPSREHPEGPEIIVAGETDLANYGCAEIVASRDVQLPVGATVHWQLGWQDYQIISRDEGPIGYAPPTPAVRALNGTSAPMNYVLRPDIARNWPAEELMHVFGTSGTTALLGLRRCEVKSGDRVLVAAASGSVGSLAAQIARAAGAYVVGLAGGEDRCDWVRATLGIDGCLDYRAPDLAERLRFAFPDGIDLFCDGVGGSLTEAVVPQINRGGRLFAYGSSESFYSSAPAGPRDKSLRRAFGITAALEALCDERGIRIECWIVFDHYDQRLALEDELASLLRYGAIRPVTDVTRGFANLPHAVTAMYARPHAGKAQVDFLAPI